MADVETDSKVISKKNEGFPAWLDFEKLRTEGINYLGELSGKLWTDHNVHDPGITILEMLCYSLLDLGYRTSLPSRDLFTKDPDDNSEENNFLTPARILACNPLTILDYRRMLVDVPGVKNAWITVADDISVEELCHTRGSHPLNGLYHVYLDLDNYYDDKAKQKIIAQVKASLMAHRNLCEDFYDITVLCKQKIGICADIEIEQSADPGATLFQIAETLKDFLSPSPKFYRLKQLLEEKGRPIEDIFAGRPYNLTQSHGFVDIEEFEEITLRKEIHISDVYNILFNIPGVIAISNLRLQNCDGSRCSLPEPSPWIFKVFQNHVPEFSIDCSGFHFTRNGAVIIADTKKYKNYLQLNLSGNGKTLITAPSPDLDVEIPTGKYRPDLAEYYPMENDFPKVYGISEGSLPENSSPERKAQALQLKGYLLFFDHLLSGYLSELKNVRNLFSFREQNPEQQPTYPVNRLTKWPGLQQLLRFSIKEESTLSPGNMVAFPVSTKLMEDLVATGRIYECDADKELVPYLFCSATERDTAIHQLMEDVTYGNIDERLIATTNGCWFFYLVTSSPDFVIAGRGEYSTEQATRTALASARYLAADKKSFRPYITSDKTKFSFNMGSGVSGYWNYLQLLTENETLYTERRNMFLDHLLARFAEKFTDYVLMSYSFQNEEAIQQASIIRKQEFLEDYPRLSSQRGKGYDYSVDGWNTGNISGFEEKFGAYAGIARTGNEDLCHFEVVEYEEQSMVNMSWEGLQLFKSEQSFDNRLEGRAKLTDLLTAASAEGSYYSRRDPLEDKVTVGVHAGDARFVYPQKFDTEDEAAAAIRMLRTMFSPEPPDDKIVPAQFRHQMNLTRESDKMVWTRKQDVVNSDPTLRPDPEMLKDFADTGAWVTEAEEEQPRKKRTFIPDPANPAQFIDFNGFESEMNRVDVKEQAIIYQYTVNDTDKKFFFISQQQYASKTAANTAMINLLFLLSGRTNYSVTRDANGGNQIVVSAGGKPVAANTIEFADGEEADKIISGIIDYVNERKYLLATRAEPISWRFHFPLSLPGTTTFDFVSTKQYASNTDAVAAARDIASHSEVYKIAFNKNGEFEIKNEKHPRTAIAIHQMEQAPPDIDEIRNTARNLLSLKKMINKLQSTPDAPEAEAMIVPDSISEQGNFGYRLVEKNGFHAWLQLDGDFRDKAEKDKKIKDIYSIYNSSSDFLEICYGGDNISARKDPVTNKISYRFQIKSRRTETGAADEMILFESLHEYATAEEAQQAFGEQYVQVLTIAGDENNYGSVIAFTDDKVGGGSRAPIVFVPVETMKGFGYNTVFAAARLAALARRYPVKSITKSNPLYEKYYLCGPVAREQPERCDEKKEEDIYYFTLSHEAAGTWISEDTFATPQAALKRFYFFIMLLKYKGNYSVTQDECDCSWKIFVREVLAVSTDRFPSADDAWGRHGVQRFICVSQSKQAFQSFPVKSGCYYTFIVLCANSSLLHPCSYDTDEKRDAALVKLFRASSSGSCVPVITTRMSADGVREKYYLEIRCPDFSDKEMRAADPCGCGAENADEDCGCCNAAWISECCFDTADQAMDLYKEMMTVAADINHYYPVFDCPCGPYGVRVSKDVTAYNPQHYTSPEMVCDAIARAKRLINAQGLHFIEHILLRPHCAETDCGCLINTCDELSGCAFEWNLPDHDPCTKGKSYPFIPGTDPYSFIATAVLPCWPDRFQKPENRQLVEQMLYREMPAHIMLRILWVTPRDLCHFEKLFLDWHKWLAHKTVCSDKNPPCELIDFVFETDFERFDCEGCQPCCDDAPQDPCRQQRRVTENPNEYVNAINQLYCWPQIF